MGPSYILSIYPLCMPLERHSSATSFASSSNALIPLEILQAHLPEETSSIDSHCRPMK